MTDSQVSIYIMSVLLSGLLVCLTAVFLLSLVVMVTIFQPGQSPHARHPQGRDTMPVTEVLLNTMVDTKIRETAIDCELLGVEKKKVCSVKTDQVLRAVAKGKGEYED